MAKLNSILVTTVLASCLTITIASASENIEASPQFKTAARSSDMDSGVPTLAPFAHIVFCKRNPTDCGTDGKGEIMPALTDASLAELQKVNNDVNRSIRAAPDAQGPAGDVWTLSPKSGDCDDYAVTKRHRLIAMGWPVSALRLVVGRTTSGEGHLALVARTAGGDLVLDNRTETIKPARQAGMSFLKIQSGTDPRRWQSPNSGEEVALNAY